MDWGAFHYARLLKSSIWPGLGCLMYDMFRLSYVYVKKKKKEHGLEAFSAFFLRMDVQ